jgi:energy-coupling factor transporter transmembrane protein EcfT
MTDRNKKGTTHENLLEILDNVIHQLDFRKKIVIIMILSFITIIPISAVVIGVLSVSDRDLGVAIPIIAVAVFLVWLGVGIRQWIVFSKWTQKYRVYKELQKKLDERLDFDQDKGTEEKQQ